MVPAAAGSGPDGAHAASRKDDGIAEPPRDGGDRLGLGTDVVGASAAGVPPAELSFRLLVPARKARAPPDSAPRPTADVPATAAALYPGPPRGGL